MSWLTQQGNSSFFFFLKTKGRKQYSLLSNEYKAQDHFFSFSKLQETREEKLNPKSNFSAISWSGLFWYEVLNYLCGTSLQCIVQRDKQIPSTTYKYDFKVRFTNPVNFALVTAQRKACFRFWQVRTLWILQDTPWKLHSKLLHVPYINRCMYFLSSCRLIKPLARSLTYSIQVISSEIYPTAENYCVTSSKKDKSLDGQPSPEPFLSSPLALRTGR